MLCLRPACCSTACCGSAAWEGAPKPTLGAVRHSSACACRSLTLLVLLEAPPERGRQRPTAVHTRWVAGVGAACPPVHDVLERLRCIARPRACKPGSEVGSGCALPPARQGQTRRLLCVGSDPWLRGALPRALSQHRPPPPNCRRSRRRCRRQPPGTQSHQPPVREHPHPSLSSASWCVAAVGSVPCAGRLGGGAHHGRHGGGGLAAGGGRRNTSSARPLAA